MQTMCFARHRADGRTRLGTGNRRPKPSGNIFLKQLRRGDTRRDERKRQALWQARHSNSFKSKAPVPSKKICTWWSFHARLPTDKPRSTSSSCLPNKQRDHPFPILKFTPPPMHSSRSVRESLRHAVFQTRHIPDYSTGIKGLTFRNACLKQPTPFS